jgi:capsular exopolysaccharide synthesis family protein
MPKPGLTDLLMEKAAVEEVIQKNVVENLDILSAGTIVRNPARILSSKNMHSLIEKMREVYDWVFIDTPPILIVNDAGIVAPIVDGAIVVVSAGTTRIATVQRAAEFLSGAGGSMLGIVLNKFDARKAYGGYYGSHRYGHYGSKYGDYAPSNGNGTAKMPRST